MSESSDSENDLHIIPQYLKPEVRPAFLKEEKKRIEEIKKLEPLIKEMPFCNLLSSLDADQPYAHLKQFYVHHLLTNLNLPTPNTDPLCFKFIKEEALPSLRIEVTKLDTLKEMQITHDEREKKAIKEAILIQKEKITQIILHNLK